MIIHLIDHFLLKKVLFTSRRSSQNLALLDRSKL